MYPLPHLSSFPLQNQTSQQTMAQPSTLISTQAFPPLSNLPQDQLKLDLPPKTPVRQPEELKVQFFSAEFEQENAKKNLLQAEKKLHQAQNKFKQIQDNYVLSYRRYEQRQDLLLELQKLPPKENAKLPDLTPKLQALKFEVQRLHAETEQIRWALEQQNTVVDQHQLQVDQSRSHYLPLKQKDGGQR